MKKDEKRSRGRPPAGKAKFMLSIDPEVVKATDQNAQALGLSRSTYIELLLRAALNKKESPFRRPQ